MKHKWVAGLGDYQGGGAPTIWCVASPSEEELRDYLLSRDWEQILKLPRRNGYAPGINTLWVKKLPKEDIAEADTRPFEIRHPGDI